MASTEDDDQPPGSVDITYAPNQEFHLHLDLEWVPDSILQTIDAAVELFILPIFEEPLEAEQEEGEEGE